MKNILITGANRGLGLSFVTELAKGFSPETENVIATCRDPDKAQELQKIKSSSKKVKVHILKLDVNNENEVKGLAAAVKDVLGPGQDLTLLINNAGYGPRSLLLETSWKDMENLFVTNAIAPTKIAEVLLPTLTASSTKSKNTGMSCSKAAIISITSLYASFGYSAPSEPLELDIFRNLRVYGASKAALNMIMRGLALETTQSGVLVVLLNPGWVSTDLGGPHGAYTPQQSVLSMLKTMGTFTEKQHGSYVDLHGATHEW